MATAHLAPQAHAEVVLAGGTQPAASRADFILFYATFSLLLFAPLAFGSADPWSIFLLQAGAVSLLLVWLMSQIIAGSVHIRHNPLFRPVALFAGLVILQVALGTTAYRYQTNSHILLYAAYASLIFLATQLVQRTSQVKTLACIFCVYGSAVALFALLQSLSSNGRIYWLWQPPAGGWIYGPYVNHNHYAGLMEMLTPIPVVMALTRHISRRLRWLPVCSAVLMSSTIFLSGSRGGMIAFLVQTVVLGFVLGINKSRRAAFLVGSVLLVIAVLLAWVGGQGAFSRLTSIHSAAKTEIAGGTRLAIAKDSFAAFLHRPLLGWGLGNFAVVYPQFRSFYSEKFVNEAHNDYLQLLVEMGVSGLGAVAWFLYLTLRGAARKIENWTWDINGAVALAALLGCIGILVHSFLDFNLQIPANASLFYVFCALAAAETKFGSHRRIRHSQPVTAPPVPSAQS